MRRLLAATRGRQDKLRGRYVTRIDDTSIRAGAGEEAA